MGIVVNVKTKKMEIYQIRKKLPLQIWADQHHFQMKLIQKLKISKDYQKKMPQVQTVQGQFRNEVTPMWPLTRKWHWIKASSSLCRWYLWCFSFRPCKTTAPSETAFQKCLFNCWCLFWQGNELNSSLHSRMYYFFIAVAVFWVLVR